MERAGGQSPYFTTEKSDLAKVASGIRGSSSGSPLAPFARAWATAPSSKGQSSSCSLSPEGRENVKGYQDWLQGTNSFPARVKDKKIPACSTATQLGASPGTEAVDIIHNQDSKPILHEDIICILWL